MAASARNIATTMDKQPDTTSIQLAVPDIALARSPMQFKLDVTPNRQFVEHKIAGWSVGLRWLVFEFGNTLHEPDSPLLSSQRDEEYLATIEQQPFVDWMEPNYRRHLEMHELATSLGLEPGARDFPVEQILIDRLLKGIMVADGVDLHGPAERMASNEDYLQFLANSMEYMQTFVGGRRFQLTQLDRCLPELSTELPIGENAIYHGFALDLRGQLPNVILDSAVGRRLGDLVSTGLNDLDKRTITAVTVDRDETYDHRLPDGWTRLQLGPDLIQLGARSA